jgi:hypothetical protein
MPPKALALAAMGTALRAGLKRARTGTALSRGNSLRSQAGSAASRFSLSFQAAIDHERAERQERRDEHR